MRLSHVLGLAGLVLCSVAGAAMAQQQQQGPVVYVPTTGATGYAQQGSGAIPFYNNTASPLPMDQLVAGKNAPSYNYKNQTKPYNFGGNQSSDTMTAEQFYQMRADRDTRAQQYQNEYLQRLAERDAAAGGYGQQAASTAQGYYNNTANPQPQPRKKKRLVYRQDADPLMAPPRLFNPDQ